MNPENKMTILVVDDDEVVGRVLSRVLTQQGHLVWQAQTARQAVASAREHSPRLALLDLCLPDGDGLDQRYDGVPLQRGLPARRLDLQLLRADFEAKPRRIDPAGRPAPARTARARRRPSPSS